MISDSHHVGGAWIVEAGEQHQRPIAHVAVGVLATACSSAGTACAAGARRIVGAAAMRVGVIEVAELVDRGLELLG